MRDVRHEIAAHGLDTFEMGDVAADQQLLVHPIRHDLDG
jgi:hypothetical protein